MSFLKNSVTVGVWTLLSRLAGFVRDAVLAATLGAGPVADAFYVAFRLPNFFRQLVAEGAFNSAFIPLVSQQKTQHGAALAKQYAAEVQAFMIAVLVVMVTVAVICMPWIIRILAPGAVERGDDFMRMVDYARVMFPYLAAVSLVALGGGYLNVQGRFAPLAMSPIWFNIVSVGVMLTLPHLWFDVGEAAVLSVLMAGVVQLGMMIFFMHRARHALPLLWPRYTMAVRQLVRKVIPAALAASVLQINILVGLMLASYLPAGAISHLWYADRISQLPIGLIGVALATALLPLQAQLWQQKRKAAALQAMNRGLQLACLLTLPASAACLAMAPLLVGGLFGRGAFTPEDVAATAAVLQIQALGLPAIVLSRIVQNGFFAKGDTRTPLWIAGLMVAAHAAVAMTVVPYWGVQGLAAAIAAASWLGLCVSVVIQYRRHAFLIQRLTARRIGGIMVASAVMAAVVAYAEQWLQSWNESHPVVLVPLSMMMVCALGAAVFAAVGYACGGFRVDELQRWWRTKPSQKGTNAPVSDLG